MLKKTNFKSIWLKYLFSIGRSIVPLRTDKVCMYWTKSPPSLSRGKTSFISNSSNFRDDQGSVEIIQSTLLSCNPNSRESISLELNTLSWTKKTFCPDKFCLSRLKKVSFFSKQISLLFDVFLFRISLDTAPLPAPYSSISSAESKGIKLTRLLMQVWESGATDPISLKCRTYWFKKLKAIFCVFMFFKLFFH